MKKQTKKQQEQLNYWQVLGVTLILVLLTFGLVYYFEYIADRTYKFNEDYQIKRNELKQLFEETSQEINGIDIVKLCNKEVDYCLVIGRIE